MGCKETKQEKDGRSVEVAKSESVEGQKETTASNSEISVPVYMFEEFEPLLNKDDGSIYVVNFWATWCKPCIKELPYFETAAEKYADKNVKVLLVSMDFPRLLEKQVIPFVERNGIKSPAELRVILCRFSQQMELNHP